MGYDHNKPKSQKTKCDKCGKDFIEREMITQIGYKKYCSGCRDEMVGITETY